MNAAAAHRPDRDLRRGFALGVAAYGLWGVLPAYFKAVVRSAAVDTSLTGPVVAAVPRSVARRDPRLERRPQAVARRRTLVLLLCTAVLIAINWLLYVHAVTSGHILAGSLGYYLNPWSTWCSGASCSRSGVSWLQWVAIAIAAAGILR